VRPTYQASRLTMHPMARGLSALSAWVSPHCRGRAHTAHLPHQGHEDPVGQVLECPDELYGRSIVMTLRPGVESPKLEHSLGSSLYFRHLAPPLKGERCPKLSAWDKAHAPRAERLTMYPMARGSPFLPFGVIGRATQPWTG